MAVEFERAILVVGANKLYKKFIAKGLALNASSVYETIGGVKYYCRSLLDHEAATDGETISKSTKFGDIVVDTISFEKPDSEADDDIIQCAALWSQRNLLHKLVGKSVAVICVIDATSLSQSNRRKSSKTTDDRADDKRISTPMMFNLIRYIFKVPITLVVKVKCSVSERIKKNVARNVAKERIVKSLFIWEAGTVEVGEKVDVPFNFFPYMQPEEPESVRLHGPGGPVKVILFGSTGSGKSTVAQMLTKGKLDPDPDAKVFAIGSGVRGKTITVEHDHGAKWYVVDTPGLGERSDDHCTNSTRSALMKIYDDIQEIHGMFTHFIYVCKQSRHTMLGEDNWRLFVRLFGEHVASNFTVVITNSNPDWVEKHMDTLRNQFKGCDHFLSADFPKVDLEDKELEEENCEVRAESLRQLEEGLAERDRKEVQGIYGKFAKMTLDSYVTHLTLLKRMKTTFAGRARASAKGKMVKIGGALGRAYQKTTRKEVLIRRLWKQLNCTTEQEWTNKFYVQ